MNAYELDKLLENGEEVHLVDNTGIPLSIDKKWGDCFYLCFAPNGHEWVLNNTEIEKFERIYTNWQILGFKSWEDMFSIGENDLEKMWNFINSLSDKSNHKIKWPNGHISYINIDTRREFNRIIPL